MRCWPTLGSGLSFSAPHFTTAHGTHETIMMKNDVELSSGEQSRYDDYLKIIEKGPLADPFKARK